MTELGTVSLISFDGGGNLLIPEGTDQARALEMFRMLENIGGAAMRGKLALVRYVYHIAWEKVVSGPNIHHYPEEVIRRQAAQAGTAAVREIAGDGKYAERLMSIALRTEAGQAEAASVSIAQHYEVPSLDSWQSIAMLSPEKQIEIIREAAENDYDALQIKALISGKGRQDLMLEDALRQFKRNWDILKGHKAWARKAKEIVGNG